MKIVTVCGMGLGSSLIVEMNAKKCLDKLEIHYDTLSHLNLASFTKEDWDLVICGNDISEAIDFPDNKKIVLESLISEKELTEKLKKYFNV